jgi:hypothetical protein
MIQEHPFGIAPGRFEFEYIPYHNSVLKDEEISEKIIVKTPHNSYLQAAVEGGVLFFLILMTLTFVFIRFLLNQKKIAEIKISLLFFTFILVNCFFEFPLDNLYPFFMTAVFLGISLAQKPWKPQHLPPAYLIFPTVALGYFSCIFLSAELLHQKRNYPSCTIACALFPDNWHFCLRKIQLQYNARHYHASIAITQELLRYNPHHFTYLWYLFYAYALIGEKEKSCEVLKRYDDLFGQSNTLHQYVKGYCYNWIYHP